MSTIETEQTSYGELVRLAATKPFNLNAIKAMLIKMDLQGILVQILRKPEEPKHIDDVLMCFVDPEVKYWFLNEYIYKNV